MKSKHSVAKIVLIAWLVFSILYVLGSEYGRLKNIVAASSYERGLRDAVVRVIQESQQCQPFPVSFEDKQVQLLNFECLQQAAEERAAEGEQ